MSKDKIKYYLKGTMILLLIFAIILVSCYGIANSSDANVRKIFYICFGSICGALLVAYWIYGYFYEKKHAKKETERDETYHKKSK